MKVIIASDLHGNLEYVRKLDELIKKENPDKIILLGDLLYHGARNELPSDYSTMGVVEILNKYKDIIIAVRGNCDSEVDNTVTDFDISSDYKEIDLDGINYVLTHGHLNPWILDLLNNNMSLQGHTHIYNLDGNVINPGSVGLPRNNNPHTCIVYSHKVFNLINLDNLEVIDKRIIL